MDLPLIGDAKVVMGQLLTAVRKPSPPNATPIPKIAELGKWCKAQWQN